MENTEFNNIENLINNIKSQPPVHIFNFDIENKQSIIGMYLMCHDANKLEEMLKKHAIMDNIKDDTILFFDRRHAVEIASILYGAFSVTKKYIPNIKLDTFIMENFINILMNYTNYKQLITKYINGLPNNLPAEPYKRLFIILKYICFIPYGVLDDMLKEAIDIFKKSQEKSDENNE